MIRVLVADDEALVRGGISMILEAQPDMEVVGQAADGAEAVRLSRELSPAVALVDIRMPGLTGIDATRQIVAQGSSPVRVVILTTFDDDEYLYETMKAGASGFLLKSLPPEQLAQAVRAVADGECLLAPAITRRLIERFVRRPPGITTPPELAELTNRELEVLRLIASGLSNTEIASSLFLSEGTVKTHVNRLFRKLELRDRVHAVLFAYETGLVQPGQRGALP